MRSYQIDGGGVTGNGRGSGMDKKDQDTAGNGSLNCKMSDLREVYFILCTTICDKTNSLRMRTAPAKLTHYFL